MVGRQAKRPPPDEGADGPRRRFPWRRKEGARRGRRPGTAAAYERSDAAEQERVIIEALEDLRDMDVREVMTPRVDVSALSIPVSADDVARAVRESGHSAFPVINGGLDDVVGVLYVNDLFRTRRAGKGGLLGAAAQAELPLGTEPSTVAQPSGSRPAQHRPEAREPTGLSPIEISRRVRQAYVIPESRPVLAALVEMRRHRRGFAVVVDEYGGLAGVLTVKDLLEPIVGELHDELDVDEGPPIVRVDGSRWLVNGQTNVDEVRDRLAIEIPEGDYVTIGGYVLDALGHIPAGGETLRLPGWDLTVQEMDKRRIVSVLARRNGGTPMQPGDADLPTGVAAPPPPATDHERGRVTDPWEAPNGTAPARRGPGEATVVPGDTDAGSREGPGRGPRTLG